MVYAVISLSIWMSKIEVQTLSMSLSAIVHRQQELRLLLKAVHKSVEERSKLGMYTLRKELK
jgi:hypothetical protein